MDVTQVIEELKVEFPDRWVDEDVHGVNPKAFTVTASVEAGNDVQTEVKNMVRRLFEVSPTAKIVTLNVAPTVEKEAPVDFTVANIGATITLSGSF